MTHNKFSSGGLYNQLGGDQEPQQRKSGNTRLIGVMMFLFLLLAAGAGFWFLQ